MARKLADVEAALQRTKEDAERATSEAQRARADAQAARESEAAAKRKLADAEAGRTAAEKACHSGDPAPSGLGARLRRWLGRPAPNH
jgi:cytochrome c2